MKYIRSTKMGWIYIAFAGPKDPVKIGWSSNPKGRAKALRAEAPVVGRKSGIYQILHAIRGNRQDEGSLHEKLWRFGVFPRPGRRPFAEWYRFSAEFQAGVEEAGICIESGAWKPKKRKKVKEIRPKLPFPTLAPQISAVPFIFRVRKENSQ